VFLADPLLKDGLLLVNKPSGPTSYDMIRCFKRSIKDKKIGHCGTLDPMATGLLILLVGRATKSQNKIMGQDKIYRITMRFGLKTDSGDATGKTIQTSSLPSLERSSVQNTLESFHGTQEQIPPMYSALKHKGQPLYKLARKGKVIERKPRTIHIYNSELLNISEVEVEFRIQCSTGTYVRTLVEDMAEKMGSCATLSQLCREKIGTYTLTKALSYEDLQNLNEENLSRWLEPIN